MTAPAFTGAFTMVDPEHVRLIGPAAAILFDRICWRARHGDGSWRATREDFRRETGLTPDMIRRAVKVLRDAEWVTTERSGTLDAALIWTPVFPGEGHIGISPTSSEGISPSVEVGVFPNSSYETDKELPLVVPAAKPKPSKRARAASALPADYRPKPAHFTLAASLGVDLRAEGPKFVDYHQAKGSTMKDWDAALRTWIRNAATFAQRSGSYTAVAGDPPGQVIPPARTDPFASGRG